MLKHIKIAVFLLILTIPFLLYAFNVNSKNTYTKARGSYFFAKTRDNNNIATIRLSFVNGNQINIKKIDNMWRIEETDDYFASLSKVNTLVKLIRDAAIYRVDEASKNEDNKISANGLKIECLDDNGRKIDNVAIAPKTGNNKYHYAIRNNEPFIYQISGNFSLSSYALDWIQTPLLAIDSKQVKQIKTDTFSVYRRFVDDTFKSSENNDETPHIQGLLSNFWYLGADDVKHAVNFDLKKSKKIKHFDISMFNGVIYKLSIYEYNNAYWMGIRLKKEKITAKDTISKIKENSVLYDGWFFKLDTSKATAILEFIL